MASRAHRMSGSSHAAMGTCLDSPFGLVDLDYGPDRRRVLDAFPPIIALVEPALWAEIFTALWGAVLGIRRGVPLIR